MYSSAECLLELIETVRKLAELTPINPVTVLFMARVLDGIADLAALIARETEFCIRPRTALRLIVNPQPKHSRRRQPSLRLITTEGNHSNDYHPPSPNHAA